MNAIPVSLLIFVSLFTEVVPEPTITMSVSNGYSSGIREFVIFPQQPSTINCEVDTGGPSKLIQLFRKQILVAEWTVSEGFGASLGIDTPGDPFTVTVPATNGKKLVLGVSKSSAATGNGDLIYDDIYSCRITITVDQEKPLPVYVNDVSFRVFEARGDHGCYSSIGVEALYREDLLYTCYQRQNNSILVSGGAALIGSTNQVIRCLNCSLNVQSKPYSTVSINPDSFQFDDSSETISVSCTANPSAYFIRWRVSTIAGELLADDLPLLTSSKLNITINHDLDTSVLRITGDDLQNSGILFITCVGGRTTPSSVIDIKTIYREGGVDDLGSAGDAMPNEVNLNRCSSDGDPRISTLPYIVIIGTLGVGFLVLLTVIIGMCMLQTGKKRTDRNKNRTDSQTPASHRNNDSFYEDVGDYALDNKTYQKSIDP